MLIALTGLKQGVDSTRVCSGKEMEEHHIADARTELNVAKGIEMVAESIPASLLQLCVNNADRRERFRAPPHTCVL